MKRFDLTLVINSCVLLLAVLVSCDNNKKHTGSDELAVLKLKRGDLVVCGPADKQFGAVGFKIDGSDNLQEEFDLGIALLHSFEYDESEKVFANIIEEHPNCAMAYWGVAMSNYHPLWMPPNQAELEKGAKAIAIAKSVSQKSPKETAYIDAIGKFYENWDKSDHRTRSNLYKSAMQKLYDANPADKEAATFYALALVATSDPTDKTFANQKQAGSILNALYPGQPNHPGVVHYIIHAYDSPELAELGLDAARKYASVAPSSAHALHMPSHIFTRLGLWDECITSNIASVSSAQCYAESTGIKGHWDEELHGLDYLMYAYLQKGNNGMAKKQLDYLQTIQHVEPINFKVAYAFAAIPSRYVLENKSWAEAANLQGHKTDFPWQDYPWQRAIIHFTRLLGAVHTNHLDSARIELKKMSALKEVLIGQKDQYKANQVDIQLKAGEGWILYKEGKYEEAINALTLAADMEDKTEKHSVTPGSVIPARELLADLLMEMNLNDKALLNYEAVIKKQPNRFNALYGAGKAAEKLGNKEKAELYYSRLLQIAPAANSNRSELNGARLFLKVS